MKIIFDDKDFGPDYPVEKIIDRLKDNENTEFVIIDNEENIMQSMAADDNGDFYVEYRGCGDDGNEENLSTSNAVSEKTLERIFKSYMAGNDEWRKENVWEPIKEDEKLNKLLFLAVTALILIGILAYLFFYVI